MRSVSEMMPISSPCSSTTGSEATRWFTKISRASLQDWLWRMIMTFLFMMPETVAWTSLWYRFKSKLISNSRRSLPGRFSKPHFLYTCLARTFVHSTGSQIRSKPISYASCTLHRVS